MAIRLSVLKKKISYPLISPKILWRAPFSDWAEALATYKLVVLNAPAGYGKTTFLIYAAAYLSQSKLPPAKSTPPPIPTPYHLAWYTLGRRDNQPAVFLTYLVESLRRAIPAFGQQIQRTLYSVGDIASEYPMVVSRLCEDLWQWEGQAESRQVIIVLDDFHLLGKAPQIMEIIEQLLAETPPFVHICLSGRKSPPLPLQKIGLKHTIKEIGFQELCFSQAEIEELLTHKFNLGISPDQSNQINRQTEGWPAGVVLTAQALLGRPAAEYTALLSSAGKHKDKIFNYFAEEILQQQSPPIQEFLINASLLENLTAEACGAILDLHKAGTTMRGLYTSGLFLITVETEGDSVYRFHHLFADFLHMILQQSKGPEHIRKIHLKAAEYYENAGQLDASLEHLWSAGDTTKALDVIKRYSQQLLDRGYLEQVHQWLERVPEDLKKHDPYFLYLKGFIHQHRDHALALSCLEQAGSIFARQGKTHLQVRSLIYMCTIYSLQNRVDKLTETSAKLPLISALAQDPWSRGVLAVSALCQAVWNDNLRRAQWLIKICRKFPLDEDWRWAMLAYACMTHYRLGELDLAHRYITEALAMPIVYNNDIWRGMALVLYHVVLYCQDDEIEGEKVWEELWEIGENHKSSYYLAYTERSKAFPHLHKGEWQQAEELLRSSLYFFTRAGNEAMSMITRLDQALVAAAQGKAAFVLEDAREAFRELCSLHCGQGLLDLGQSLMGVVAREAGELGLAEQLLLASAKTSKSKGAKQILAGTLLHLSRLYHLAGDMKKGDGYLRQFLQLAESKKYVIFWDWHRPTVLKQCLYAAEKDICAPYANHLLQYWFKDELETEAAAKGRLQILQTETGPQKPAQSQSGQTAQPTQARVAAASPQIKIYCFGNFEMELGAKSIPVQAWKTRKVQGIFKYLILQEGRRVSREQLMELFWPESPPQAAAASLRVSLSRLRAALDYYKDEGLKASFLLGEGQGNLWFKSEQHLFVDAYIFLKSLKEGNSHMAAGKIAEGLKLLEQAKVLYRGQLLADDLYTEWSALERERFEIAYLELLLNLGKIHLRGQSATPWTTASASPDSGKLHKALAYYTEALSLDPYREDIYLKLMQINLAMGEKAAALRIFKKCHAMLDEEFGLIPGEALQKLAQKIKGTSHR